MKKAILLCLAIIIIIVSGCNSGEYNNGINGSEIIEQNPLNELISIYNISDELINEFHVYGSIHLTDCSLIYSQIPYGETENISSIDYYRYYFETDETVKLGSVDGWSYESRYNTTSIADNLYLLITVMDEKGYSVCLYRIDLDRDELLLVFSERDVTPYNSMAAIGDKLLITYPLNGGGCILEKYDTKTDERKTVMQFEYNNETDTGLVIRQITSDDEIISLLMLKAETDERVSVYMDIYDHDMNFLKQVDLDALSNSNEEIRQPVSCFYNSNIYVYYENFSVTRFFGKIIENATISIKELNGDFAMVAELEKNKTTWLLYESFVNDIYLFETIDGTLKRASFYAHDAEYTITFMMRAGNDNILIAMDRDGIDIVTGNRFSKKLYYLNLSDIEFN